MAVAAASGFIILGGFILLQLSSAATFGVSAEAESGTLGGNAKKVASASASGGQHVQFSGTTPTPGGGGGLPTGTLKIMPFGDSITDGGGSVDGAYRIKLEQSLTAKGYDFDFVGSQQSGSNGLQDTDHEGHGGWCLNSPNCYSSSLLAPQTAGWVSAADPDLVLVHGGTNDLNSGDSGAEIAEHLQTTLNNIYSAKPTVRVIVAKIVKDNGADVAVQQDYASRIDGIVSTMSASGKAISSVDMTGILSEGSDYVDETHPNLAGYNKMADTWMAGITAVYGK